MGSTEKRSNSAIGNSFGDSFGDALVVISLLIFTIMCLSMPVTIVEGTKFGGEGISIDFHYSYKARMVDYLVGRARIAYRNYKYEGPKVIRMDKNIIKVQDRGVQYIYLK